MKSDVTPLCGDGEVKQLPGNTFTKEKLFFPLISVPEYKELHFLFFFLQAVITTVWNNNKKKTGTKQDAQKNAALTILRKFREKK